MTKQVDAGYSMTPHKISIFALVPLFLFHAPVLAKDKTPPPRPAIFQQLVDCRTIADAAARLACYDLHVAEIDAAEKNADVVVVDREQVKTANRGLFGLGGIHIGSLFGKSDTKEEEIDHIEGPLKSASQGASGRWTLMLDDGARWVQIDDISILAPKPGHVIRIRKAAMGSFFATINGKATIRVKRQN
jgi:hypothetical protein